MKAQGLKSLRAASLIAAFVAAAIPVHAGQIKCDVPFGFFVNGKALPAGTYLLSANQSALLVNGAADGAVALTDAVQSQRGSGMRLVFHKYGDRYILREAWTSDHAGRAIHESAMERELKLRAASGPERVSVPAS